VFALAYDVFVYGFRSMLKVESSQVLGENVGCIGDPRNCRGGVDFLLRNGLRAETTVNESSPLCDRSRRHHQRCPRILGGDPVENEPATPTRTGSFENETTLEQSSQPPDGR
jgi:hypothetical protein